MLSNLIILLYNSDAHHVRITVTNGFNKNKDTFITFKIIVIIKTLTITITTIIIIIIIIKIESTRPSCNGQLSQKNLPTQ